MTAPAAAPGQNGRWVGAALTRKEDDRLLRGRGRFVGDMTRAGMLHAAFVRSPFPAASVTGIDPSVAREARGVAAVFTSAGLGDPFLLATLERDEFVPTRMPLLAGEQVRFAGEPVAMAVAADAYLAEDAAELVEVGWAPGPAVAGLAAAQADGAPQVHPETSGNCHRPAVPAALPQATGSSGSPSKGPPISSRSSISRRDPARSATSPCAGITGPGMRR